MLTGNEDIKYRKQLLDNRPTGRREFRRPWKRQGDGYNREAETGHSVTWWI